MAFNEKEKLEISPKNFAKAEELFYQATTVLLMNKPFYAHVQKGLIKSFEENFVKTMCVYVYPASDGRTRQIRMSVNRNFVLKLYDEADTVKAALDSICECIEHEILHVVFGHLQLDDELYKLREIRNYAADCEVNSWLREDRLPKGCVFPKSFKFEPKQGFDFYYWELKKKREKRNGQGGKGGESQKAGGSSGEDQGGQGDSSGESQGQGEGEEEGEGEFLGQKAPENHRWRDRLEGESNQSEEEKMANRHEEKRVVGDLLESAKRACNEKQWGNVPAEIRRAVDYAQVKPERPIRWERHFRIFATSAIGTELEFTHKKISKRFGTRPGPKKDESCSLLIGLDVSGSIPDGFVGSFFDEVDKIAKIAPEILIATCDTKIHDRFRYVGKRPETVDGCGGTDMEPLLQEAVDQRVDGLVIFTDGYCPRIEKRYRVPTLIVSWRAKENDFYKWGNFVFFNPKLK